MATLFKHYPLGLNPQEYCHKTIKERFVTAGFTGPLIENIAI
jgi:hypothetical protein